MVGPYFFLEHREKALEQLIALFSLLRSHLCTIDEPELYRVITTLTQTRVITRQGGESYRYSPPTDNLDCGRLRHWLNFRNITALYPVSD